MTLTKQEREKRSEQNRKRSEEEQREKKHFQALSLVHFGHYLGGAFDYYDDHQKEKKKSPGGQLCHGLWC